MRMNFIEITFDWLSSGAPKISLTSEIVWMLILCEGIFNGGGDGRCFKHGINGLKKKCYQNCPMAAGSKSLNMWKNTE